MIKGRVSTTVREEEVIYKPKSLAINVMFGLSDSAWNEIAGMHWFLACSSNMLALQEGCVVEARNMELWRRFVPFRCNDCLLVPTSRCSQSKSGQIETVAYPEGLS